MRALVTGACGFVGTHLIRHLVAQGDEVLGGYLVDTFKVVSGCRYERLDVRNFEECSTVIGSFTPDVIYHLAGIAFVPEAEKNFDDTLSSNVAGLHNVMRIPHLREKRTKVVVVSSAEVYGLVHPNELPITEDQAIRPTTNYSLSKRFAELVAEKFGRGGVVEPIIMRPFNHIGPGQNVRFAASNFAFQLSEIAQGRAAPTLQVGNLDVYRDFSDVRDIVRAYRLAAHKGKGVYNLCSGVPTSIQWILDELIRIAGVSITIEKDPERMRPAEMPTFYGDRSKAERELGWVPEIPLTQSLQDIYQYWVDQRPA